MAVTSKISSGHPLRCDLIYKQSREHCKSGLQIRPIFIFDGDVVWSVDSRETKHPLDPCPLFFFLLVCAQRLELDLFSLAAVEPSLQQQRRPTFFSGVQHRTPVISDPLFTFFFG